MEYMNMYQNEGRIIMMVDVMIIIMSYFQGNSKLL